MIRTMFADPHQQYQYHLSVHQIRELKHVKLEVKYQSPKFPDGLGSTVEFFMNEEEWKRFKELINSVA